MPFTCEKIRDFMSLTDTSWNFVEVKNINVKNINFLFEKLNRNVAITELEKLKMKKR